MTSPSAFDKRDNLSLSIIDSLFASFIKLTNES